MAAPVNGSTVRIEVSDYGPIAKAQIDLKPLTVFVGPSNTGKSYLAILIYALHRLFNSAPNMFAPGYSTPLFLQFPSWMDESDTQFDVDEDSVRILLDWMKELGQIEEESVRRYQLPAELADIVRPLIQISHDQNERFCDELARCFGTQNTQWLKRHGSASQPRILLTHVTDEGGILDQSLKLDFSTTKEEFEEIAIVSETKPLEIDKYYASELKRSIRFFSPLQDNDLLEQPHLTSILFRTLTESVRRTMFPPFDKRAHYLPADRTGVMHAHQVVVASIISAAPTAGLRPDAPLPSMSGVLADFLNQLLVLGRSERSFSQEPEPPDLGTEIETHLLGGTIHSEQSDTTSYPIFSYLPQEWENKLPLMNSSSMVSELAPVALYLRNVVQLGEVLIIEEPESHLHPGMQVEFIRQVARVIKSGIRVMLTTHSEWVLEELANLVRLSDLDEENRTGGLETDTALNGAEVGVWLFDSDVPGKGSIVKEIKLDIEEGNFASGYEDVALRTYNKWASISNRIERDARNDRA